MHPTARLQVDVAYANQLHSAVPMGGVTLLESSYNKTQAIEETKSGLQRLVPAGSGLEPKAISTTAFCALTIPK